MHVRISTESTKQLPLPNTAAFLLTALATTHAADRVASPSRGSDDNQRSLPVKAVFNL